MQKITMFLMLFVTTVTVSPAQNLMVVNDKNAEERKVGSFHGIRVSNAFDVIIQQGNEEAVVVSASEEKHRNRIRVEVKDGILRIWYDNDGFRISWNENRKLRAYISVKNLDLLDVSGACDVKIDGQLKGDKLRMDLSGASSVKGELIYNEVKVEQSGASDANLSGRVQNLSIGLSGASDFKGFELVADYCKTNASGASDVKITVNKDLKINASGASDVDYKGNATISSFSTSGSSSVRKRS